MTHPRFFGYGSLVNLATHSFGDPRPATLPGWRRVWRGTTLRPAAYLSAEPHEGTTLHGLTAEVPHGDWAALDERETAYTRQDIGPQMNAAHPTWVYRVSPHHLAPPGTAHPILLSYLDTVVQGYLRVYGPPGVAAFFASTSGWDTPIQNDRAAPLYPRAQTLTRTERALVDRHIAEMTGRPPSQKPQISPPEANPQDFTL